MLRVEGAKWLAYYGWAQVGPMTEDEHDIHKLVTMLTMPTLAGMTSL